MVQRGAAIDTTNQQGVGVIQTEGGPRIAVTHPRQVMTFDQALVLAAYLVLMTMREAEFLEVLDQVRGK